MPIMGALRKVFELLFKMEQNNLMLKYLDNFLKFQFQELCCIYFILKVPSHIFIMHNLVILLSKIYINYIYNTLSYIFKSSFY